MQLFDAPAQWLCLWISRTWYRKGCACGPWDLLLRASVILQLACLSRLAILSACATLPFQHCWSWVPVRPHGEGVIAITQMRWKEPYMTLSCMALGMRIFASSTRKLRGLFGLLQHETGRCAPDGQAADGSPRGSWVRAQKARRGHMRIRSW